MSVKNKKAIANAIMAGAKLKEEGKPIPFLEGDEELEFSEGKDKGKEKSNITKAFSKLFNE